VLAPRSVIVVVGLVVGMVASAGCQMLTSGTGDWDAGVSDAAMESTGGDTGVTGVVEAQDAEIPVGQAGCSDGTREGFRDFRDWPDIAGCSGGFADPGVLGGADLAPACDRDAGDSSSNPNGTGCNVADLCAQDWHVCRDGQDVSRHSPTGDCESCVSPGEHLFFLVATGASTMGVCSNDATATNDLHGCGDLGQPETAGCDPLFRRMGFADCRATGGVWWCGDEGDHLREAVLVIKNSPAMGGVLCCRN
jgi:hypothetical protein